ncbi:MAG: hypothetical protein R3D59_03260 [Paracoccaceae bacterium]
MSLVAVFARELVEALLQGVVAGEVEVDHVERGRGIVAARRAGLDETRGHVPALGQQEPADLGDMGAGGEMDVVALAIFVEP